MKLTRRRSNAWLYLAAWCIPALCMLAALYALQAYPFGEQTIILRDATIQYVDFSAYWQSVLSGDNNLLYTFSKNLGGDMISLAAYYLLSPFNALFIFSNVENLPLIYTAVIILKTGLCGLTFFYAAGKRFGVKPLYLAFSTCYALAAYTLMYGWSLMWLDGVIVLPLLGLGVSQIVNGKSAKLYVVVLAYALATQFYIGYMLCLASVLFFGAELLLCGEPLRSKGRIFGKYAFASVVGGLSTAVIWVPTLLSLMGERVRKSIHFTFTPKFSVVDFASKYVIGAMSPAEFDTAGWPFIFCGMLALLLVVLFFFQKQISRKVRLVVLLVFGILFLSFYLPILNVIWHGFTPNIGFNYRYAFIFSYVMLMVGLYTASQAKPIPWQAVLAAAGVIIAGLLVIRRSHYVHNTAVGIYLSIAVLCAYAGCLVLKKNLAKTAAVLLVLLAVGEMGVNGYLSLKPMVNVPTTMHVVDYQDFVRTTEPAVSFVKAQDDSLYRMEKDYVRTQNDAMLLQYNGLSHFSSTEDNLVTRHMSRIGFSNYLEYWAYYGQGTTAGMDALHGVKYLLSRDGLSTGKPYGEVTQVGQVGIYQNPYALPLVMYADPGVKDAAVDLPDPFAIHNAMWQSLTGSGDAVMQPAAEAVLTTENLLAASNDDGSVVYTKEDPNAPATLRYELTVENPRQLYFFVRADKLQSAELYVNGEGPIEYFDVWHWQICDLGSYEPGETVRVEIKPRAANFTLEGVYFYHEDLDVLADLSARVKAQPTQITRQSSSRLSGSIDSDRDGMLLFTIPYDEGWRLYLDGEKVETEMVWDIFLATEVTAGEHTFEMYYIPVGMIPGGVISAAAILAALVWELIRWKNRKKKQA